MLYRHVDRKVLYTIFFKQSGGVTTDFHCILYMGTESHTQSHVLVSPIEMSLRVSYGNEHLVLERQKQVNLSMKPSLYNEIQASQCYLVRPTKGFVLCFRTYSHLPLETEPSGVHAN